MNQKAIILFILVLAVICPGLAQTGRKQRRPLPYEYGQVVIDNYSEKAGRAPVVFEHWIHRAKFTCRVCHVDLGFAMKAGGTGVTASDNERGYYCGACHDGKRVFADGKTAFAACSQAATPADSKRCDRCHSWGKEVKSDFDFFAFSAPLPKERFGNGIDWVQAEESRLIQPVNFIDGISLPNWFLPQQLDFELNPKVAGMPDIIFSHEKHIEWNGCELCHPDIFIGVRRGVTHYTMVDNFNGKFCGACHTSVAFPLTDCQRCHSKPVLF